MTDAGCSTPQSLTEASLEELQHKLSRYAPVKMTVDLEILDSADRKAIEKLVQAAAVMNDIILRQRWAGNLKLLAELREDRSQIGLVRSR